VFDVNSGGGMVAGCFELAEDIYASRSIKPSIAMIDSGAYSAAYALASSASKLYVTPSGGAGSIGCVAMHMDLSKFYEDWGIEITLIYSGQHKVDGNPYEGLPEDVKADIQKSVDACREKFVTLVARNRGIESQLVKDTEAQTYDADESVQLGLVDAITTPLKAVAVFFEQSGSVEDEDEKGTNMSKETTGAAENTEATNAQSSTTTTDARKAERARISEITGCTEAEGKGKLANHLALNTELSVDEAKGILAAAPTEVAQASTQATNANPLDLAMDLTQGGPNVGTGEESATGGTEASAAQRILEAQALATGSTLQ
jgi:ClpP class serine protease